ncbi:SHOCT domain-containing protein [Arthrobacter hankyongi]|uniref:SHOCT domain-containing protein n=1 Tax=Arthrobacter hankyongi TaxID=2904801 RepID=UPI0027E02E1E|nr:SHOCT domain-containing protein [Arthrobacter hankyongi]
MDLMSNFWNFFWTMFWIFAFVAYLFVLFGIIGDLFRDRGTNGWLKAVWMVFLIFLPFLTALVYLIARGRGMAERQAEAARQAQEAADSYIRGVAGSSGAEEIAKANALRESGAITQQEFELLKARALAGQSAAADAGTVQDTGRAAGMGPVGNVGMAPG